MGGEIEGGREGRREGDGQVGRRADGQTGSSRTGITIRHIEPTDYRHDMQVRCVYCPQYRYGSIHLLKTSDLLLW